MIQLLMTAALQDLFHAITPVRIAVQVYE